jgi:hypothetical protein
MRTDTYQFTAKKKSVTLSPQANYSDRATATGRRILVLTFADRQVSRDQRGRTTTAVNLSFLDRSRYFFFQIAPQLLVDSVPDPLLPENLVVPGTSGSAARNSDN